MDTGYLMTGRGMIKFDFTKKDRDQLQRYIKDLEETVSINKEILNDLISGNISNVKHKDALLKLNKENANLSKLIKTTVKQRDDAQYKALINAQLTEDYKEKEREIYNECQEKIQELKDQLSRKEYMLQHLEKKYYEAEKLLKKYAKNDIDIRKMIESKSAKDVTNISNVVVENEGLKNDLNKLKIEKEILLKEIERMQHNRATITPKKEIPILKFSSVQKSVNEEPMVMRTAKANITQLAKSTTPRVESRVTINAETPPKPLEENQGTLNTDDRKQAEPKSFSELSSIINEANLSNNNDKVEADVEQNEIQL
jgi:hypothetical protein